MNQEATQDAAAAADAAADAHPRTRVRAVPHITDLVHYRAYGTPGGEFPAACRAAIVTGVGAWVTEAEPDTAGPPADGDMRTVVQRWHADAISATVLNPSGEYRGILVHDQSADPRGGTWHYPGAHCRPGGTR